MSTDRLLARIERVHGARPATRGSAARLAAFEAKHGRLPAAMRAFYRRFASAALFGEGSDAPYLIVPLTRVRHAGAAVGGGRAACPSSWVAFCQVDGDEWLAVDLASRHGRVIDCFHETFGPDGEATIVAGSFREFLTRVLQSDGEPYWLARGFRGLGNAYATDDRARARPARGGAKRAAARPGVGAKRSAKKTAAKSGVGAPAAPAFALETLRPTGGRIARQAGAGGRTRWQLRVDFRSVTYAGTRVAPRFEVWLQPKGNRWESMAGVVLSTYHRLPMTLVTEGLGPPRWQLHEGEVRFGKPRGTEVPVRYSVMFWRAGALHTLRGATTVHAGD